MLSLSLSDHHPHEDPFARNVAITVVVLSLLYWTLWSKWIRVRLEATKPFLELPMLPNNHFFWGHFRYILCLLQDFGVATKTAKEVSNEYGIVGYWLGRRKSFWVTHWEDVRTVLLGTDFRSPSPFVKYHLSKAFGPRNIFFLRGRAWKVQRTTVLKSLIPITSNNNNNSNSSSSESNLLQQAIAQVTTDLIHSLHNEFESSTASITTTTSSSPSSDTTAITTTTCTSPPTTYLEIDMEPLMKMVTIDVFGKTALHSDFRCCQQLAPSPMASAFDFLGAELTRRMCNPLSISNYWYSLPTALNRKHFQCQTLLRTAVTKLIQDRRRDNDNNNTSNKTTLQDSTTNRDLLSLLLQAHDDAAKGKGDDEDEMLLADETLRDVLVSLVFAGYDTTSIGLTYAFYLLATHPEAQHHCWQEVERIVKTREDLSTINVDDLVFCKGVILESLRLFPPAFLINRSIDKDLPLRGGFIAPTGANAVIPIWIIHHTERNFPFPDDFRPDRWVKQDDNTVINGVWTDRSENDDSSNTTIPPGNHNALFIFSGGSRSCPGQKFAMHESILTLASLVKEFQFREVPGYIVQPVRNGLVQTPKGGLPLRLVPRHS